MKTYLGDAVYAELSDGDLILTTSDGIRDTNRIYLDTAVLANLKLFIESASAPIAPNTTSPDDCYTPEQIACECAGFAHDNFDPADEDQMNSVLTPDAIWQGWHEKDGVPVPEMPVAFAALYFYECERIGGADFADDIRKLAVSE